MAIEKNNRKVISAWCSYDIANSVYSLIVAAALFPIYYERVTAAAFADGVVSIFGHCIKNTVLYDYSIAIGYAFIILITPLLSGIADMGGYRKRFMVLFTIIGSAACSGLYFFTGGNIGFGLLMTILAVVGWAGATVYYNSFLPIIATPRLHNIVSAKGFAWGYLGSMILFIFSIIIIYTWKFWGFGSEEAAYRFSFLLVGIWWIGIATFSFRYLTEFKAKTKIDTSILAKGFKEIATVAKNLFRQQVMNLFLVSFLFLSMGVQTILLVATLFGSAELHIGTIELIIVILLIQFLAMFGSVVFARVSNRYGNFTSLLIMLSVWVVICVAGYFIQNTIQFYILATFLGFVMGGIQSQARSTYAMLIPPDTTDTASYFSFYDITEKIGIVIGMFGFGFIEQISGSMRNSVALLSVFFIIAFVAMAFAATKRKLIAENFE
ncbi:MAG: MFS transporter [Salinivirgaceae bacterium]|nr:MFS transporter [Salinivirgaceae bacterium]